MSGKIYNIGKEMKRHAPFTLFGALTGIVCMLVFSKISQHAAGRLFYIFHPSHVILSAMVTAGIYKLHSEKPHFLKLLFIGYVGSIGIATLSDSIIPYIGEVILGMHPHHHIGFIEGWYIVNPAAVLGVLIAYLWPKTKFPHAGHVLFSTWASSFHILMAMDKNISVATILVCFVFLFMAVWLPCCVSDIVFPLLFVKGEKDFSKFHNH